METHNSLLPPDQKERDKILTELDKNVIVEAAAGTGKTKSIVDRMIALIQTGTCRHVSHLAAVTFMKKAAAELRFRFQIELEKALKEAGGTERENLRKALADIEQCFIGTVHSFCGKLLRERPVEARIDLDFEEIDDDDDELLKKEAWNAYVNSLYVNDPESILEKLRELNLEISELESAFIRFADFPDVDEWPHNDYNNEFPDRTDVIKAVRNYARHMRKIAANLPDEWGNDKLIPKYRTIPRMISYKNLENISELVEVLNYFSKSGNVIQKEWEKTGFFSGDNAKAEKERWNEFRENIVTPVLNKWYENRYKLILEIFSQALKVYDNLRRERGKLNFQDLLMKAAALLRDNPHIRNYFRQRFTHVLVDEFQDTDPVQAEVMLLLTATDPHENDWRKCVPYPGSLFVVGDPKQSIYRFRRADIVTYNEVKRIIKRGDGAGNRGLEIQLSANFRTVHPLIDWINLVFGSKKGDSETGKGKVLRFPEEYSDESPSYVPLQKGRTGGDNGTLSGMYTLTIPDDHSNREATVEYEADRIARIIRNALDKEMTIPRTPRETEKGISEKVTPSDFMIITKNRKDLNTFSQIFKRYDIPHRVTGASSIKNINELRLLYVCLKAVIYPDDPVALVAVLRSELFGFSDPELYAFKKSGGVFSFNHVVPENLPQQIKEDFRETFTRLRNYYSWLVSLPWLPAIQKIVHDLGLLLLMGKKQAVELEAGGFLKALELLRKKQNEFWSVEELVNSMGELIETDREYEGISARSTREPFVRIMNLHKTKGLESQVVFLANPFGESPHDVKIHVDRSGRETKGYIALFKKISEQRNEELAHPPGWDIIAEREKKFIEAEKLRLRYVAATRAGAAMIVSLHTKGRSKRFNPWQCFETYLSEMNEIDDPDIPKVTNIGGTVMPVEEVKAAYERIAYSSTHAVKTTYSVRSAKEYSLQKDEAGKKILPAEKIDDRESIRHAEGSYGSDWGSAIHEMLCILMKRPDKNPEEMARKILQKFYPNEKYLNDALDMIKNAMQSDVWKRARKSTETFAEIPFHVPPDDNGEIPVIIRGNIDVVFKENGTWILADYKTDSITEENLDMIVKRYTPQLKLYASAWKQCTGEEISEALLVFLRPLPGSHESMIVSVI